MAVDIRKVHPLLVKYIALNYLQKNKAIAASPKDLGTWFFSTYGNSIKYGKCDAFASGAKAVLCIMMLAPEYRLADTCRQGH